MSEQDLQELERELLELGRSIVTAPPRDDLATAVLARIEGTGGARPSTRPAWLRGRRLGWAVAAATVLLLALIPPVRAAVLELLRIGGVVVREEPPPSGAPGTSAPVTAAPEPGATVVSLPEAERLVGLDVGVPTLLGAPTTVAVAREGRVVELTWQRGGGLTRLDVLNGSLSWGYLKTVWNAVTPTQVNGQEGVWLGSPHLIEWVDRRGSTHREQPRMAGPTLVWVVPGPAGEVTYRLEGPTTLGEAIAIAQSLH